MGRVHGGSAPSLFSTSRQTAIMSAINKIAANSPSRAKPSELETSIAGALYDLESNTSDLKAALRPLQIVSAREVEVGHGKKAIVIFVPVPSLQGFHRVQQRPPVSSRRSSPTATSSSSPRVAFSPAQSAPTAPVPRRLKSDPVPEHSPPFTTPSSPTSSTPSRSSASVSAPRKMAARS